MADLSVEHKRLAEAREKKTPWRLWGPYLSERQWGTVREDYSRDGNAWNYFPHDHARSRAYKWGEDGIAGISDEKQRLCFALAFWNEKDPILKERLFGLTNSEGNHGEDVKEYYFYLDSTPTHSWMQMLYKYPQEAYPYDLIVKTNRSRGPKEWEYELLDTKVFDKDRYFDIFVEFAKAGTEDLYVRIRAVNRGNAEAPLHILPHLWFRNTWWMDENIKKPVIAAAGKCGVTATHPELGLYSMAGDEPKEIIFTENETNTERLFHKTNATPHVKDAFHRYLINGETGAVNPARKGTKAAFHYVKTVPAGKEWSVTLRLSATGTARRAPAFSGSAAERVLDLRKREADAFYDAIMPRAVTEDDRRILRQGFSGMLWSKQTYIYEVDQWLKDHGLDPQTDAHKGMRNSEWFHMANCDVISMPDKWEYPWFAAWDLAFHTIALSFVDPDFANQQLDLMLRERYLHPSGQIPAYEWNFGDVNPPVHAWATIFNYRFNNLLLMKEQAVPMLKRNFHKLLLNFTWWVNRKDPDGKNVFEGGFLGMDNIGVFDRSSPLPTGGRLEQADGTAWMSLFAQNMLEISLLLAEHDPVYEDFAIKFYDHFVRIAASMDRPGERIDEMWDEKDGFFYDVLRLPDGRAHRLKIRSMVGLLPLCAVTVFSEEDLEKLPAFAARIDEISRRYPEMVKNIYSMRRRGVNGHRMLSVLDETKLRRVLSRMLDPDEFLSDYGIRSLSKYHEKHPYTFTVDGHEYRVGYLPAESDSGMFGGNSNWRGPIWMPVNILIFRALLSLYGFYGDAFKVECPVGSGRMMTLFEVAQDLVRRLANIFRRGADGRRPVYGETEKFQKDPHWRDYLLFYEYFHGDCGAGIGASHQTGWTGLIAALISFMTRLKPELIRERQGRATAEVIASLVGKRR